eukprot:gb/GECG01002340.1/.p1 GENE.gb/GECG01002340.1/~~gb/GECG01002340.1/.p1  ORF type:complete len:104 (+),score=22.56 gb/GECG01002340.1/:1-312(+)
MSLGGGGQMVGGFGQAKPADDEVRGHFETDEMKRSVQEKLGKNVDKLEVVEYKTQVVAGTNFRVKARVNDAEHVAIHAFRALPHEGGNVEVKQVENIQADSEL